QHRGGGGRVAQLDGDAAFWRTGEYEPEDERRGDRARKAQARQDTHRRRHARLPRWTDQLDVDRCHVAALAGGGRGRGGLHGRRLGVQVFVERPGEVTHRGKAVLQLPRHCLAADGFEARVQVGPVFRRRRRLRGDYLVEDLARRLAAEWQLPG